MDRPLLLVFVLVQAGTLVLLTAGLAIGHRRGLRRDARRAHELERARLIVRRLLTRRLLASEALLELESMHGRTLAAVLHELYASRVGEDRDAIIQLLRHTRWFKGLPERAASRFWWRRLRAARALAEVAGPEHLLVVHALLDDPTPVVRLAAAAALGRLPSPGLATALLGRAIVAQGAERNHLVEILAESDTLVLPVMIERLSAADDEATVRVLLDLTGRLGFTSLLPYVIRFAEHESLEVRVGTATCLRNFPHPQSSNTLRRLVRDRAWAVRARAAASLGAIGAVEAIDDLLLSLRDPVWWVRLRAAIALRLVGPGGVEALRQVDPTTDRYAFDMAHYILGLDDGAMAEHAGGAIVDFGGANLGELAG